MANGYENVECHYCHEMGHTKFNCKKRLARNQKLASAHAVTTSDDSTVKSGDDYAGSTGIEHPTSTTAVFAGAGNPGKCLVSSTSKWVIDSGASDHMTGFADEEDYW